MWPTTAEATKTRVPQTTGVKKMSSTNENRQSASGRCTSAALESSSQTLPSAIRRGLADSASAETRPAREANVIAVTETTTTAEATVLLFRTGVTRSVARGGDDD